MLDLLIPKSYIHPAMVLCFYQQGLKGNPVRIRDCPAAVNGNDRRHKALILFELGSDDQ